MVENYSLFKQFLSDIFSLIFTYSQKSEIIRSLRRYPARLSCNFYIFLPNIILKLTLKYDCGVLCQAFGYSQLTFREFDARFMYYSVPALFPFYYSF